jgi:rfaE bifunctional protein kinase chain/domain
MSENEIKAVFDGFGAKRIALIGDVMLDSYVWGKVDRISPEAPVPVVLAERREYRLGGAANVALNLMALGAKVDVLAAVGKDYDGDILEGLFDEYGLNSTFLMRLSNRTTVKTRIMAQTHHLLRIDEEVTNHPSIEESTLLKQKVLELLDKQPHALVFEDYDKGLLNIDFIEFVVEECRKRSIPIAVDPKKQNFIHYRKVDLFKPNLKEIKEGLNLQINPANHQSLRDAHQRLEELLNHKMTLITLSEHGVFCADEKGSTLIEAHLRSITDVSGAGDTVISVAALCMASGMPLNDIAAWANVAGGLACEKVGVVPTNKGQLLSEIIRLYASN